MRIDYWQILGGLIASSAILLVMFVVILGPLQSEVIYTHTSVLWDAITYTPYVVIGGVSVVKRWKAFGITLVAAGVVAVLVVNGFVFGLSGSFAGTF